LKLQDELGIDLVVEGQMDRSDTVTFFAERLEGMELAGLVRCFGNRYYRKPRIVGAVTRERPITVESWKAVAQAASKPVKAILTGPYTLMDWSFDEHYGSREKCCMALADVVRAEAQDLVAAGAEEIEIDEQAIAAVLVDESPASFDFGDEQLRYGEQVLGVDAIRDAREKFAISYGSCSFTEPLANLRCLNLLAAISPQ